MIGKQHGTRAASPLEPGYSRPPGKRSILGLAVKHSSIGGVRSMTASGDDPVANIIEWPGKRRPMPDGGAAGPAGDPSGGEGREADTGVVAPDEGDGGSA